MKLVKVNPRLQRSFFSSNLDHFFNDFFNHGFSDRLEERSVSKRPATNVITNEDSFQLEIALPGLNKEDIDLQIEKDILTISAQTKSEKEGEEVVDKVKYSRKEFDFTSFKRTFHLDETIDTSKVGASYENGVLLITLPKKEEVIEKSRAIEIA